MFCGSQKFLPKENSPHSGVSMTTIKRAVTFRVGLKLRTMSLALSDFLSQSQLTVFPEPLDDLTLRDS